MQKLKQALAKILKAKPYNQKTIDRLNQMTEQSYKMTNKPLFLYGVMWRLSGNDKFMLELRAITNSSMHEIVENLKPLKASNNDIKNYYLATGKFPSKIEDKFLCEYGFDNWYNSFRSGLTNVT